MNESTESQSPPRVFISYSHDSYDHRRRVLALSERLREDGIDADLDQYVKGTPREKWPRWMLSRLDWVDFVLLVCTPAYYRRFRGHEAPGRGGDCGRRVVRGGSWNFRPEFLRSANRNRNDADNRDNNLGFRLAQSARAALRPCPESVCPRTGRAWCAGVHEPVSRSRTEGSAE